MFGFVHVPIRPDKAKIIRTRPWPTTPLPTTRYHWQTIGMRSPPVLSQPQSMTHWSFFTLLRALSWSACCVGIQVELNRAAAVAAAEKPAAHGGVDAPL